MERWLRDLVDDLRAEAAHQRRASVPSPHWSDTLIDSLSHVVAAWALFAKDEFLLNPMLTARTRAWITVAPEECLATWAIRQRSRTTEATKEAAAKALEEKRVTGAAVAILLGDYGFAVLEAIFKACLAMPGAQVKPEDVARMVLTSDGKRVRCEVVLKEEGAA